MAHGIALFAVTSVSFVPTASLFTLKNTTEENTEVNRDEEEDDFQTDEDEEMEVDAQVLQKRKKVCRNLKWEFTWICHH